MILKAILKKLKTASGFSAAQWKMIAQAYFFLLKARLLLLFFPLSLVQKAMFPTDCDDSKRLPSHLQRELLSFFKTARRYQMTKPNCLATSLALQAFLTHYGFSTRIRIGVRKEGEALQAHAWCEKFDRTKTESPIHSAQFHTIQPITTNLPKEENG